MKKLLAAMVVMTFVLCAAAQVGIGTNTPNSNAVLDIFSPSKGFLIPRIIDTGTVTNPLEGMIIYNKQTKTPYYHDGKQWLSLGGRLPSSMTTNTDRITYQVTAPGFSSTEEDVYSLSHGVSTAISIGGTGTNIGASNLSSFNFSKIFDLNSKSLNLAAILGTQLEFIEFKVYATGAEVPYLSYRYKKVFIESYQISGSAGGGDFFESVSIAFENYGFKDWVHNLEFGYNVATKVVTAY